MTVQVVTVLRSGGVYTPEYVRRLQAGLQAHLPNVPFRCLSDDPSVPGYCPLQSDWPGWWAKMELFRPDLAGDILYLDLDTVITGSLADMAAVGRLTLLRDFYHYFARGRANGYGSGLMYLPHACRAEVWNRWIADPDRWMAECGQFGDQRFLEEVWMGQAACWQDLLPGQVVSFKAHCQGERPASARLVCYHGQPRPHETGWAASHAARYTDRLPPADAA